MFENYTVEKEVTVPKISLFSPSCPFGKMSFRQKVRLSNKMSVRQSVRRQTVRSAKCRSANYFSAKCLSAKCLLAKCPGTQSLNEIGSPYQSFYLLSFYLQNHLLFFEKRNWSSLVKRSPEIDVHSFGGCEFLQQIPIRPPKATNIVLVMFLYTSTVDEA